MNEVTQQHPPNIMFFVVDDVAHDRWAQAVMPSIRAFEQQAIAYPNFYTQPLCSSSRCSILTGMHPEHHGVGKAIQTSEHYLFPASMKTMPEWLRDGGYRTIAAGKWHLDDRLDPSSPGSRGFDTWRTMIGRGGYYGGGTYTDDGAPAVNHHGWLPEVFPDWAIDAVNATPANQPFFLWYSFILPHSPFHDPPPEYHSGTVQGTGGTAKYLRMMEAVDTIFRQVVESILATHPNTWIVLLSDNGTPSEVSATPGAAKSTMFANGINCPLFIRRPQQSVGWQEERLAHVTDLFPTVMELSSLQQARPANDGINLLAGGGPREFVVSQEFAPHGSHSGDGSRTLDDWGLVTWDGYKLVRSNLTGDHLFLDDDSPVADQGKLDELGSLLDAHIGSL